MLKRLSPLIFFFLLFALFSNWPRISLWLNPIEPVAAGQVELYETSWCMYCKKAKAFLNAANVDFVAYDIEKNRQANRRYKSLGGHGVPVVKIGDDVIYGYDAAGMRKALRSLAESDKLSAPNK